MAKNIIKFLSFSLFVIFSSQTALADSYVKTYSISAYYSPIPCQDRYVTGSYDGDRRLNGNGTNGADGTQVYPGMVAAPKTVAFGTKMFIPGIGTVGVHDRGGAIVASNGQDGVYDRLDIWMGHGDIGLQRALAWGLRSVDVTVYGVDPSVVEGVSLLNYDPSESIPRDCDFPDQIYFDNIGKSVETVNNFSFSTPVAENVAIVEEENSIFLETDLKLGDRGAGVTQLQQELRIFNYFLVEPNGIYGPLTEHAVFKFQQGQGLVGDMDALGAGEFGPKTRGKMNEIISAREYSQVLIADANTGSVETEKIVIVKSEVDSSAYLSQELEHGSFGPDVRKLQQFLINEGYFHGALVTDYFGNVTRDSLIDFQIANNIVSAAGDFGAGRVGPSTLRQINESS